MEPAEAHANIEVTTTGRGAKRVWHFSTGWTVRFSGRTERQAIREGELEWLARVASDTALVAAITR
ncbi:MAG: hypothetical protein ACOC9T_00055 [Myxococcota bacterium]